MFEPTVTTLEIFPYFFRSLKKIKKRSRIALQSRATLRSQPILHRNFHNWSVPLLRADLRPSAPIGIRFLDNKRDRRGWRVSRFRKGGRRSTATCRRGVREGTSPRVTRRRGGQWPHVCPATSFLGMTIDSTGVARLRRPPCCHSSFLSSSTYIYIYTFFFLLGILFFPTNSLLLLIPSPVLWERKLVRGSRKTDGTATKRETVGQWCTSKIEPVDRRKVERQRRTRIAPVNNDHPRYR